jgi:hypothetical protein
MFVHLDFVGTSAISVPPDMAYCGTKTMTLALCSRGTFAMECGRGESARRVQHEIDWHTASSLDARITSSESLMSVYRAIRNQETASSPANQQDHP